MNDLTDTLNHVYLRILPEIILVAAACVVFLGGTFRANRHLWAGVSLAGIALAAALIPCSLSRDDLAWNIYVSPVVSDSLALFLRWLTLGGGVLLVLLSWNEIGDRQAGDFFGCLLVVLAGLSLVGSANDLVTLFLALEMISIPTYVMLYLPRHDKASQEAAVKYFMLSIFSSALLLFGFSYLYGLTGSTNLSVMLHTLNQLQSPGEVPLIALLAVIMVVAGLGFRIAAVPFHFYAPDVYQGTSPAMAGFLAFVPKVAGIVALLRVFGFVLPAEIPTQGVSLGMGLSTQVPILLWFLAAITMTIGNIFALLQDNLRRIFAYSSIAHAGYMLIALAAVPYLNRSADGVLNSTCPRGVDALLFYLVAYGAMTIGVFAVLAYLHSPARPVESVDDLAGLSRTHPAIAFLMTIFLFSLIGIPFTAGFTGKFFIFLEVIGVSAPEQADSVRAANPVLLFRILALIGMVNAAIGAWYYLRLISVMYLRTTVKPVEKKGTVPALASIVLCALLTVGLSVPPGATWLFTWVKLDRKEMPARN